MIEGLLGPARLNRLTSPNRNTCGIAWPAPLWWWRAEPTDPFFRIVLLMRFWPSPKLTAPALRTATAWDALSVERCERGF